MSREKHYLVKRKYSDFFFSLCHYQTVFLFSFSSPFKTVLGLGELGSCSSSARKAARKESR